MSSSYSCEEELKKLANDLYEKADELRKAAEVLETLRDSAEINNRIQSAQLWAKQWMERKP